MTTAAVGIKLGIDGVQKVQSGLQRVVGDLGGISKASIAAKGALAALGVSVSVGGLLAMAKSAINSADAMSKLSQSTGIAVKEIAGLQLAFQQSGLNADQLEQRMGKLARKVADGDQALAAMGITAKKADGTLKPLRAILGEVADKFASYEDGASKAALAQRLFDESATDMIPLLNGGSAALEEFDKMAERLGLTMDEKTAKQAERFNDTIDLLSQGVRGVATKIAGELLPTLVDLASQFLENMTVGDGFKRVATGLSVVLRGLAVTAIGVVGSLQFVGKTLGALAGIVSAWFRRDWEGAKAIAAEARADLSGEITKTIESMKKALSAGQDPENSNVVAAIARTMRRQAPVITKDAKDIDKALKDAFSDDVAKNYTKAMEQFASAASAASAKALGLTKTQTMLRDIMADPTWAAMSRQMQEQVIYAASLAESADTQAAAAEARKKATEDAEAAQRTYNDSLAQSVQEAVAEANASEHQLAVYGMLESAVHALTLAKLEEQRANHTTNDSDLAALELRIAATKRLIAATKGLESRKEMDAAQQQSRAVAERAAQDAENAWRQAAQSISNSLSDALMRGFEDGKSFARNLRDTLVNMFKSMVLRPVIQAVLMPVAGAMAGLIPGAANAGGGGGVGGAMQGANMLSGLTSMFKTGPGSMMGNIGLSINNFGNQIGSQMVSEFGAGMYAGATEAGGAMGAGGMAGTVGSFAMGAFAGVTVGRAISGGFAIGGGSGKGVVNLGTAIGAVIAGPIGAAIGGALGGLANRLFGRKETDSGVDGFAGSAGFSGGSFRQEKGGLLRSDRTVRGALDPQMEAALDRGVKAVYQQAGVWTEVLGLSAETVRTYNQRIKISLRGLNPEEAIKAIEAEFGKLGEGLANAILSPEQQAQFVRMGEGSADALMRLSSAMTSANAVLDGLGQSLFELSLVGADAASALVDLFGGADAFASAASVFYDEFYTDAERAAITTRLVAEAMADLGIAAPGTREEFRRLVEAQDLTSEAGRANYVALMNVAGAFASVTESAEDASRAVADQRAAMDKAERDLQNRLYRIFEGAMSSIQAEVGRLRGGGAGMANLQSQFAIKTAQARAMDRDALDKLPAISRAIEDAARLEATSGEEFRRVQEDLARSLSSTLTVVSNQVGTGPSTEDMVDELRAARELLAETRTENEAHAAALVRAMNKFTAVVQRWDMDGMPETRELA